MSSMNVLEAMSLNSGAMTRYRRPPPRSTRYSSPLSDSPKEAMLRAVSRRWLIVVPVAGIVQMRPEQ